VRLFGAVALREEAVAQGGGCEPLTVREIDVGVIARIGLNRRRRMAQSACPAKPRSSRLVSAMERADKAPMKAAALWLTLILLGAPAAAQAPDWVMQDRAYAEFLTQLQGAVRSGDRRAVSNLVRYPLRVNSGGRTRLYRSPAAVRRDYPLIFTPNVRRAILAQRFEALFGRDQGVMIGNGEIWFDHVCRNMGCEPPGPVRISAINR
jgi:hypothetical protein